MEAKVDIRKLQFLNDRIAQVTDALNQVRLSVHGLQQQPQIGYQSPQLAFPQQFPYSTAPLGFQHTPYPGALGMNPFGQLPWQGGSPGIGQAGWGGSAAWLPLQGGGLYHSPSELMEQRLYEQRANDPGRILHTFPLCLAPIGSSPPW